MPEVEKNELVDIAFAQRYLNTLLSNTTIDERVEAVTNLIYIAERLGTKYGIFRIQDR